MKEKTLQTKIIKYLESCGAYVRKISIANRNGTPDILGCLNGKFFGIEVKGEGNRVTQLQDYNLKKIEAAGGSAIVARTMEDVFNLVRVLRGENG